MGGNGTEEKILKLVAKHDYGLTIEEIASALAINRMTASKYLVVLQATGKIIVRDVGKAKLHYPKTKNGHRFPRGAWAKSSCSINAGFIILALLVLFASVTIVQILEYVPDLTFDNVSEGYETTGKYLWGTCRDCVESNVTREELISGLAENRTFLKNETAMNRTVLEEEFNKTSENRSFLEHDLNVTETNETFPRLFLEKVVGFSPVKERFGMNEKPRFRLISKNVFSEQGKIIEEGTWPEVLNVFVYGPDRKLLEVKADVLKVGSGEYEIELSKGRAFRAGLYKIRMEVKEGNETYEKEGEFLWGVLAINTHKSIYLENEQAFIGMAVLDDQGHMVCNADVTLQITDSQGVTTTLGTSDGTISVSPECELYGVTNLPDYYASYIVNKEGTYTMNLTAITMNGVRSMTDAFEVKKRTDFDVARNGPTRIYPPAKYSMIFVIKANKDYEGLINEYVPSGFEITPNEGMTVTDAGDAKILSWDKKLTPGETYEIGYEFDAPDISPSLFILGPLEIGNWKESRQWMIASDAPARLYDSSFTVVTSPISLGQNTTFSVVHYETGDPWSGTITLTVSGGATITNACGSNQIRIIAIQTTGTMASYCAIYASNVSCSILPASNPAGTINWTVEGCAVGTSTYIEAGSANLDNTGSLQVQADNIPPSITIVAPKNRTYGNLSINLNYTVTDYTGVDKCWYNLDKGANTTLANCANTTFDTSEGTHTLYLFANDTLGNLNSITNVSFSINTTCAYPGSGDDWIISNTQMCSNRIMTMTGNLTIQNGGNLTFRNVTLKMNSSSDGQYGIKVQSGGAFYIYDNDDDASTTSDASNITAVNTTREFFFKVDSGSTFAMKNSLLSEAGWSNTDGKYGLEINATGTEIRGNTITNNYRGLTFYSYSDNNIIANNIISSSVHAGIFLYSSSNTLANNTVNLSMNSHGIYLSSSSNNTLTNNTANSNTWSMGSGIYLQGSSNNTLTNNTANSNYYAGIYIDSSSYDNNLTNNTADSNIRYGIYLQSSSNTHLTGNTISNNVYDMSSSNNIYSNNKFIHNINNTMITVSTTNQTPNVNDLVGFNISLYYLGGGACDNCAYNITTRPYETVSMSKSGNSITGNFTATRLGLYSLLINVTEPTNNNNVIRNYAFLVNTTEAKVDYYFRDVNPTHGQPTGIGTDAKSLLLTPPTTEEYWSCSGWVQASPDDLTVTVPSFIKDMNMSFWYKAESDSYTGVERYTTYDSNSDYNQSVPIVTVYTWINRNFTVNWSMDYVKSWYRLAVKLRTHPTWYTNQTNPSYVNISYLYTTTPQIKNNTNTDVLILSATSPASDTNNATIYLDGTGSTNLTVQMPNTTINYSAKMDGNDCNDANCNLTSQANGELNFTLTLGSEHNITIEEESDADPTASLGTNPVTYYNDSDGSIVFDLKCSDNIGVSTLKLYGNWSGWHANQTNSSPTNNGWWNVTVSGIPEGTWKWDAWCNDTINQADWSNVNRTFTVDLTNPQIGSKHINNSGSVGMNTIVCLNVSGVSDNFGVNAVWTTVTQSNGSIFNITMSDTGSCAGSAGDGWYSVNVNVGDSAGTFFYNTTYVNDSSGRINSNTTVLNLSVSACNVDFAMTSQLEAGIRFAEQDPDQVNVSAVDNGNYNITDLSTAGCGTVNVSIMATGDLVNGSSVIGIGNVTVNSTSPDSQVIQLSTGYQLIRSNVPAGQSNITTLYFWLSVPQGQDPNSYNTTIYIKEERG